MKLAGPLCDVPPPGEPPVAEPPVPGTPAVFGCSCRLDCCIPVLNAGEVDVDSGMNFTGRNVQTTVELIFSMERTYVGENRSRV